MVQNLATGEEIFKKYFKLSVRSLCWLGLKSMNSIFGEKDETSKLWEAVYTFGIVILVSVSAVPTGIAKIILLWNENPTSAIEPFCHLLPGIGALIKGFRLCQERVALRLLLKRIRQLWLEQWMQLNHRPMMIKDTKIGYQASCIYAVLCTVIFLYHILDPYRYLIQQYLTTKNADNNYNFTTVFPAVYPFEYNTVARYVSLLMCEKFMLGIPILCAIVNESIVCQLIQQLSLQFELLSRDLENITEARATNVDNQQNNKKLEKLISRHIELLLCIEKFQIIFGPTVFYVMLTCSITLCMDLFVTCAVLSMGDYVKIPKFLFQFFVSMFQLLLYCGFGETLRNKSLLIADASYKSNWIGTDRKFRSSISIVMLRAQKPVLITGYSFFPLTLQLFTAFASTGLSYFTLLNSIL